MWEICPAFRVLSISFSPAAACREPPQKKSPFPGSGSIPIQKNGVYWDRRKSPFGPTIAKEKIRPEAADKEAVMSELLVLIGVVAAWYLIQGVILPRMGVST
jgi:hypothetical protein